jgi:UDP-N-acetylmuramoyl-L-alanyl-D-glutamate--2,6-diaminopimelate ligase
MSARKPTSMNLRELFEGMDVKTPDLSVSDITSNSRHAERGGLFLACAGIRSHGLEFLDAALEAGVAAVAWEPAAGLSAPDLPDGVAGFAVPGLTDRIGVIADRFFSSPSSAISVTGVTGTNGKSTTAFLVTQALNGLGRRAGYMGTLGYGFDGDLQPSSLTTPGCISVHRRLRAMADGGASHVVAEVSSHALDQHRVDGVRFDVAAMTNLSRDHLDYHGSMDAYAEAKARLFVCAADGNNQHHPHGHQIRTAVINVGDRYGMALADRIDAGTDLISVALVDTGYDAPDARLIGRLTGARSQGLGLQLSGDFGTAELHSPLWGRFNAENLVVAAGILLALGFELENALAALAECEAPPGRMEIIRAREPRPTVVVDFAHTPDALGKALETIRDHCEGKVWCVFGCGGDRDRGKRGPMGAVAAKLADRAVITDDNPRDEDPESIVREILAGTGSGECVEVVHDRAAAIGYAIRAAQSDDIVLIAGKGHESQQIVGAEARAFSDAAVARVALGSSTAGEAAMGRAE